MPTVPKMDQNTQTKEIEIRESGYEPIPDHAPREFDTGAWLDPANDSYSKGRQHQALMSEMVALAYGLTNLESTESAFVVLAEDEPNTYQDAMKSPDSEKWMKACRLEYDTIMGYVSWDLVQKPPEVNVVGCRWIFRIKRDNLGQINKYKA